LRSPTHFNWHPGNPFSQGGIFLRNGGLPGSAGLPGSPGLPIPLDAYVTWSIVATIAVVPSANVMAAIQNILVFILLEDKSQ
jgi:hypothetical protein